MAGQERQQWQRTVDGDADVGLLQRGRVVHAVAGHAHHVVALLQDGPELVLVLGEHLGEAIRLLHQLPQLLLVLHMLQGGIHTDQHEYFSYQPSQMHSAVCSTHAEACNAHAAGCAGRRLLSTC